MSRVSFRVRRAARVLDAGGVVAYPTEAVWGLGCDPGNENAVQRLLYLKRRPAEKGLILVAASIGQFDWLLRDLPAAHYSRLQLSWPGAITWLVPHGGRLPDWISGQHSTVALRVSAHPVVRALVTAFGGPLVSSSANRTGARAAVRQFQVWRYFGEGIDDLVPGKPGDRRRPSMIRDLLSDTIVRPG